MTMLKRVFALFMVLLLSSSCATTNSFQLELNEFNREALKRRCFVLPVNIYFARLEEGIAGYCIPVFGILLNEDAWEDYGTYQRKELVFHELGHCVLGLDHTKIGLMAPRMHPEKDLQKNWEEWVDLLFKDCFKV